jgi:hypothetical protein
MQATNLTIKIVRYGGSFIKYIIYKFIGNKTVTFKDVLDQPNNGYYKALFIVLIFMIIYIIQRYKF